MSRQKTSFIVLGVAVVAVVAFFVVNQQPPVSNQPTAVSVQATSIQPTANSLQPTAQPSNTPEAPATKVPVAFIAPDLTPSANQTKDANNFPLSKFDTTKLPTGTTLVGKDVIQIRQGQSVVASGVPVAGDYMNGGIKFVAEGKPDVNGNQKFVGANGQTEYKPTVFYKNPDGNIYYKDETGSEKLVGKDWQVYAKDPKGEMTRLGYVSNGQTWVIKAPEVATQVAVAPTKVAPSATSTSETKPTAQATGKVDNGGGLLIPIVGGKAYISEVNNFGTLPVGGKVTITACDSVPSNLDDLAKCSKTAKFGYKLFDTYDQALNEAKIAYPNSKMVYGKNIWDDGTMNWSVYVVGVR